MRIISEKRFREFIQHHAAAAPAMANFVKVLRGAVWKNIQEARVSFPHAGLVSVHSGKTVTVFNVGGNRYRVIARIAYDYQIVYVLTIMTHAEYSKDVWKDQL